MATPKPKALFICTHNAGRSQMAEGLLRALHGDRYEAFSAGIQPSAVNPYAIRAMAELGIDITAQRSKHVAEFDGVEFDYVVTVCDHAREACPFFPGKTVLHRGFDDPAALTGSDAEIMAGVRRVRDEIRAWIEETFGERDSGDGE